MMELVDMAWLGEWDVFSSSSHQYLAGLPVYVLMCQALKPTYSGIYKSFFSAKA